MNTHLNVAEPSKALAGTRRSMTRLRFFLHELVLILSLVAIAIAAPVFYQASNRSLLGIAIGLMILFVLIFIFLSWRWTWLRVRDAGYSGWYSLILASVPFVRMLIWFTPTNYRQTRRKDGWMICGFVLGGVDVVVSFFGMLAGLNGADVPQKRYVDDRVSMVIPAKFIPIDLKEKSTDQKRETGIVKEQAWKAAFNGAEVAVDKIQYESDINLSLEALLSDSPSADLKAVGPLEWQHSLGTYQAARRNFTQKGASGDARRETVAEIVSGNSLWIVVGGGDSDRAERAATAVVRSLTFQEGAPVTKRP